MTKTPQRINVELLAALCDILNCNAGDLLQLRREHVRDLPVAVNDSQPGIGT
ncbi:helix-turn-helix transcriptional regulator [Tessaracoccus sp. OS52]|uniref:helix-turn-helix domain-containing protein n=1 Tax=Tessaracoccus sp. OS52 TaxID=2886691 RepID=UPI001D1101A5|nr:helix-turn-helix domain-containing protein [Tessaracoccus sp. OS52]MCC2592520.1 helix-turn-helix transcriptional regulator [Tessaracoccus sp. OS52]